MSSEEIMKIANLGNQTSKINIQAIVLSKNEKLVNAKDGRKLRVADYLVEDDTGKIFLTLWETDIDKVNVGDIIKISNGYITTFKNNKKLQLGKWGKLEIVR